MEVCYTFHCIDFHRTHNRSTTLHGSLICLSLYRFSLNSQQISYIAWKSATPTSVHIVIETCNKGHHSLDALHCTDVYISTSLHADILQVTVFRTANKKTILSRFSRNSCLVNNCHTEIHENPTEGSTTDMRSWTDDVIGHNKKHSFIS
jgi:hypothetical protein